MSNALIIIFSVIIVGSPLALFMFRYMELRHDHFKTRIYWTDDGLTQYGVHFYTDPSHKVCSAKVWMYVGLMAVPVKDLLVKKEPLECEEEFLSRIKFEIEKDLSQRRLKKCHIRQLKKRMKSISSSVEALKRLD